jgi:hypothetical protein
VKKWLILLLLSGCGGKKGNLKLDIVVSPVDDPFADATNVKFTIGDDKHIKTVPVMNGKFSLNLEIDPISTAGPVIVEAYNSSNMLVAHGQTFALNLNLNVLNQEIAVWVGRPGRIAGSITKLSRPLAEMTGVMVPQYGLVIAGGRGSDGTAVSETELYDIQSHQIVIPQPSPGADGLTPMNFARAGAQAVLAGNLDTVVVGGSAATGFGSTATPSDGAESFAPIGSSSMGGFGTWTSLDKTNPVAPRTFPTLTVLSGGNALVSGGFDANNMRLASAATVVTSTSPTYTPVATSMVAPRALHASAAATFSDGKAGALLLGGLDDGSNAPVAEKLVDQNFSTIDLPGLENRLSATATTLPSGKVLLLGGSIGGTAVASGWVIETSQSPAVMTSLPAAMSSARAGHSATLVNGDVLVCGGADQTGAPVDSCDLIDGSSFMIKTTQHMANARRGHLALQLETGPVVILGGFGSDGKPLSAIEIYTP